MSVAKLCGLFRALAAHDRAPADHSFRVRLYALRLADEFRLPARQRRHLGVAALLHDVGKLHLPGWLLNKPAALTPEEARLVREHPAQGERLLLPLLPRCDALAS